MALIRFELHDEDIFGEKHLIGQAMYPVSKFGALLKRASFQQKKISFFFR